MPTSKSKNLFYRAALPCCFPHIPGNPFISLEGHDILRKRRLAGIIRRNHLSGGAIAIKSSSDCSEIFTKSIHTTKMPGNQTYFRVASITKMATALLAVLLMDRGILDPEKPVSELLPDGSGIPELNGIMISQLLSHTSGLVDPPDLERMLLSRKPLREAAAGCRKYAEQTRFCYSNLGFGIIGCIFETLLEEPVDKIFRDYLFKPLGLNATLSGATLSGEDIMPVKRISLLNRGNCMTLTQLGRIPVTEPEPSFHYGYTAGSMYITLPSLVRLTECIRDGGKPLISGNYAGLMKQEAAQYGAVSPTLSYGYGLLRINDKRISDSIVIGHQGFAYGCVDGAFWEETTGNLMISLNGSCSEARTGRLGYVNMDLCRFAFREEIPLWK